MDFRFGRRRSGAPWRLRNGRCCGGNDPEGNGTCPRISRRSSGIAVGWRLFRSEKLFWRIILQYTLYVTYFCIYIFDLRYSCYWEETFMDIFHLVDTNIISVFSGIPISNKDRTIFVSSNRKHFRRVLFLLAFKSAEIIISVYSIMFMSLFLSLFVIMS